MSSGAPVRMPRLNVDRRAQLIEATIDVVYRDGLSRLTLAKVAQQAGLSTSIVNFYFKTKEQLLQKNSAHVLSLGRKTLGRAWKGAHVTLGHFSLLSAFNKKIHSHNCRVFQEAALRGRSSPCIEPFYRRRDAPVFLTRLIGPRLAPAIRICDHEAS